MTDTDDLADRLESLSSEWDDWATIPTDDPEMSEALRDAAGAVRALAVANARADAAEADRDRAERWSALCERWGLPVESSVDTVVMHVDGQKAAIQGAERLIVRRAEADRDRHHTTLTTLLDTIGDPEMLRVIAHHQGERGWSNDERILLRIADAAAAAPQQDTPT